MLKDIIDALTKLLPDNVSVKSELPITIDAGLIAEIIGTGFRTVNVAAADVPPPGKGLNAVTLRLPPTARSAAVTLSGFLSG